MATPQSGRLSVHAATERDETGAFVGQIDELPGCVSQEKTEEENLLEALQGCLAAIIERVRRETLQELARSDGKSGNPKTRELVLA